MAKEKRTVCGLLVQWEDGATALPGTTYKTIGFVQNYTPPNIENEEVDTSTLDNCLQEASPSRQGLSQITLMIYYDPADTNDVALRAAALSRNLGAWKITWPDPSTNNQYEEFLGWILSFVPQQVEQTSYQMAELTIRIKGAVTYAAEGP